VVGDGKDRARLESLVMKLGLQNRIIFLGERRDVVDILLASDIFVLSTHIEGLPISVIEACCAGVPIIATGVGSLADLPRQGLDMLLTKPGDSDSLRDALLSLADPARRESMVRHLPDRARAMFSIEQTTQSYLSVYRQITIRAGSGTA
jgi:glycosyltransferase involved in cell wall biosynthesis